MKKVECKSTGVTLPEKVAREVDALVKTLPSGCSYQRKAYVPETQFEPGERAEVSILTTASRDKTNEVVLPEGVELDNYRKNSVVLYEHDKGKIVGEGKWIKHHGQDDSIRAKTVYFEKSEPDQESQWYNFCNEVWLMVKSGALKGKSIGFLPLQPLRDPTEDELKGHPDWAGAGVWEKTMLLEYSVCTIGICNDAIVEAINTKSLDPTHLRAMGIEVPKAHDDCVSKKIKWMHDNGEASKYSDEQIDAIAYAHCHGKSMKKKKKTIDVNKALADAIDRIDLDVDRIVEMALEAHRNRGRV